MATAKLLLQPGANLQASPTLNKTQWAETQCVRFYAGLLQKLGGWARYCGTPVVGTCRALLGWADLSGNSYVATGTEQRLQVISGGFVTDVTPVLPTNNAPNFSTVASSTTVTIIDGSSAPQTVGSWVNIVTPVTIGGVVLSGYFAAVTTNPGGASYTITAPSAATSTVNNAGAVPAFTTNTVTPTSVSVALAAHGLSAGSSFYVPIPVVVGGITLMGAYTVQTIVDSAHFTITAANSATSTATVSMNGGNAALQYLLTNGSATNLGPGYGIGDYGSGDYGLSATTATASQMRLWALDHWGQDLVAAPFGGTVYYWQPNVAPYANFTGSITTTTLTVSALAYGVIESGQTLYGPGVTTGTLISGQLTGATGGVGTYQVSISQSVSSESMATAATQTTAKSVSGTAPLYTNWIFVVPEVQILMTLGAESGGTQYPLLARWCDASDFTDWTPSVSNQAGSFQLNSGSTLVFGVANGLTLYLWTDLGVWSVTYQGLPYVFSFNELARECGAIGPNAVAVASIGAVWLSTQGFFQLTGGGVQPMECVVWDFYNNNVDTTQLYAITAALNTQYHEVSWYFLSTAGTTCYVKWNWVENVWDYGTLTRTAWIDASPAGNAMGVDGNGLVQQHEVSNDADGTPLAAYAVSGYFDVQEGDDFAFLDMLQPDFVSPTGATISLSALAQDYPGGMVRTTGALPVRVGAGAAAAGTLPASFVTCGIRGRQIAIQVASADLGSSWRLGALRYRFRPDGSI